jgi:hypothetical protein
MRAQLGGDIVDAESGRGGVPITRVTKARS